MNQARPDRIHYLTNRIEHLIAQASGLVMGSPEHTRTQGQLREHALEYYNLTGNYYRHRIQSSQEIIRRRRVNG